MNSYERVISAIINTLIFFILYSIIGGELMGNTYPKVKRFGREDNKFAEEYFKGEKMILGHGISLGIPYNPAIWLEACLVKPDLVERDLDVQLEMALKCIEFQSNIGIKFLRGGGDFASNSGPFYSKEVFKKFVLPRLKKISHICHKYDCYHMFASDGNLWPVGDYLFKESEVDAYFEIR